MAAIKEEFRQAMGFFATGVTIVTSRIGEQFFAMTANAVASVSLEPLLLLVCVDKTALTYEALDKSGIFSVSILNEMQESLSRRFAIKPQPDENLLEGVGFRLGNLGCPIIDGCLAYLDCRVTAAYPGGDHTIFLGEVEEIGVQGTGRPLIFYRGGYTSLDI